MMTQSDRDPKAYAIVVGFDFETAGETAFNEALRFAAWRGDVVIHAVHVISEHHSFWSVSSADAYNERMRAVPGKLRDRIRARWSSVPEVVARGLKLHVRVGDPATALEQSAVDYDAELIIVGTRARHGGERFAVGSVITRLLETARCPVLVAHPKDFSLMASVESPEPMCPNCARERATSQGARLWCEYHARPEARAPAYGYSERYAQSGGAIEPVK